MKEPILLGYISGAFGLKGGLKVKLLNQSGDLLPAGTNLFLKQKGKAQKTFTIKQWQRDGRIFLEGLDDRDAALAWQGSEIFIERAFLPKALDDEFYLHDLLGSEVRLINSNILVGKVSGFSHNGAQDLLEIFDGSKRAMLPMVPAIIISIDIEQKIVMIDPPLGLLDL